ncbi:MAG: B12-binding domain-containing radical SAM protein [Bacteroidota bacterium]
MNILLVNPYYPDTFWSFRHALKFISRKASFPPLGLLTVASMLPREWPKRLIDLNIERLADSDLAWADFVFLGGMSIQKTSADEIIARCKRLGKTIVAGGPLFTSLPDKFPDVDHLVLNEAENTLPLFLSDLAKGRLKRVYTSDTWADITHTPVPLWDLVKFKEYSSMNLQYSRGCPYDCEFCDITVLYGRIPRTKTKEQVIRELESLYAAGWKSQVFFVDDNFIGNRQRLKKEILPALIEWMDARGHPFFLNTEVSINIADDLELMRLMVRAGFDTVFVGIESPNEASLVECWKIPNKNRDLLASVKIIQQSGLQIQGGFIVGFDNDPPSIFDQLITFIQESGIVTAMVGLLNAPNGTRLYKRLLGEGRLLSSMSGDNTDFSLNFIPKMDTEFLVQGYKRILQTIYGPKEYYARVKLFLTNYDPQQIRGFRIQAIHIKALVKSVVLLGVIGRERFQYWKLFLWSLLCRPRLFPLAITFSIYGYHFRRVFEQYR